MESFPSYLTSLLRVAGAFIGGWLVSRGYFTAEEAASIGGALFTVLVALWAINSKRKATKALKAAILAPAGYAE